MAHEECSRHGHHAGRQLVADAPARRAAFPMRAGRSLAPMPAAALKDGSTDLTQRRLWVFSLSLVRIVAQVVVDPIAVSRDASDGSVRRLRWFSSAHVCSIKRTAGFDCRRSATRPDASGSLWRRAAFPTLPYWTFNSFATKPFFFGSVSSRIPLLHLASDFASSTSCINVKLRDCVP